MGQIIAYDVSVFIYVFEDNKEFYESSKKALTPLLAGNAKGIFSSIGLIELLTGPKKRNRGDLAFEYKQKIWDFPNLMLKNLNLNIIDLSSDLRAKYGLHTADAVHIATAIDSGATKFYTNDKKLKAVKEIKVETL